MNLTKHINQSFFPLLGSFLLLLQPANGAAKTASKIEIIETEYLSLNSRLKNDITISAYILKNSSWKKEELLSRFKQMNQALKSCGHEVSFVELNTMDTNFSKVRVDDFDKTASADGMQALGAKLSSKNNFRFFYFEEYVEPFSSAGVFPFAISPSSFGTPDFLHGTAWFPFQTSVRMKKQVLPYSEEAHELGHLLLDAGHDSSGAANILSDKSSLRINSFSVQQCAQFKIPKRKDITESCSSLIETVKPIFIQSYETYNIKNYMTQWCIRNSENLYRALRQNSSLVHKDIKIVYMIHRTEDTSIKPKMARDKAPSWSNHAFLVLDGLVLDQDFTDGPVMLPFEEYMQMMWGDRAYDYRFQVRKASEIDDYTNYGVRESFKKGNFPEFDFPSLREYFSKEECSLKKRSQS